MRELSFRDGRRMRLKRLFLIGFPLVSALDHAHAGDCPVPIGASSITMVGSQTTFDGASSDAILIIERGNPTVVYTLGPSGGIALRSEYVGLQPTVLENRAAGHLVRFAFSNVKGDLPASTTARTSTYDKTTIIDGKVFSEETVSEEVRPGKRVTISGCSFDTVDVHRVSGDQRTRTEQTSDLVFAPELGWVLSSRLVRVRQGREDETQTFAARTLK